jgi:hypothetical protein
MNPKTTAVLFAIAAALAAFVYFYEIEGEQARVEAKAAEKRLFPNVEQGDRGAHRFCGRHVRGRWRRERAHPVDE